MSFLAVVFWSAQFLGMKELCMTGWWFGTFFLFLYSILGWWFGTFFPFLYSILGIIPIDEYFSEGLKPPIRHDIAGSYFLIIASIWMRLRNHDSHGSGSVSAFLIISCHVVPAGQFKVIFPFNRPVIVAIVAMCHCLDFGPVQKV